MGDNDCEWAGGGAEETTGGFVTEGGDRRKC